MAPWVASALTNHGTVAYEPGRENWGRPGCTAGGTPSVGWWFGGGALGCEKPGPSRTSRLVYEGRWQDTWTPTHSPGETTRGSAYPMMCRAAVAAEDMMR